MTNNSKVTEIRQKLLVARALKTESNRLDKLISIIDAQFSLAEQMEFKLNEMLRQVSRTRVESSRKIELQLEEIHFLIETTFDSIRKVRNNNGLKAKVSLS